MIFIEIGVFYSLFSKSDVYESVAVEFTAEDFSLKCVFCFDSVEHLLEFLEGFILLEVTVGEFVVLTMYPA